MWDNRFFLHEQTARIYLILEAQILQHAPGHGVPPPVGTHVVPGRLEHAEVVAGVLDDVLDRPGGLFHLPFEGIENLDLGEW